MAGTRSTTDQIFSTFCRACTDLRIGQRPDHMDRAVEHICFLVDVNRLHDNALGLYDLDLTLLVAQQSQKVFRPMSAQDIMQKLTET